MVGGGVWVVGGGVVCKLILVFSLGFGQAEQKKKDKDHPEVVEDSEDQIPPHNCVAQQTWTEETRAKRLSVTTIPSELKGGGGHS